MIEEIDKILFEINEKGFIGFAGDTPVQEIKAMQRLVRLELIKSKSKDLYDLTDKGQEAVDLGGYEAWLKKQQTENQKNNQIKDLTIKQLKGNIFQIKSWWWLLIINAIIAIIATNFRSILEWIKSILE